MYIIVISIITFKFATNKFGQLLQFIRLLYITDFVL